MDGLVVGCPVPREQQPMEEYQALKESWFFRWATLPPLAYMMKLLWVWGWSWVVSGAVAASSFTPQKYPGQFFLLGSAGAILVLLLVVLRLYLGWVYVRGRLASETIPYEESGWYDGQTWAKPPEVIARDRLVVSYEVKPILLRLHQTFGGIGASLLVGSVIWWFF